MRLCVLGNSHLGALKLGWETARQHFADVEAQFFGLSQPALYQTCLDGGELTPVRPDIAERMRAFSGGQDRIPLATFDAIVLVGMVIGMPNVLRYLHDHAVAGEGRDKRQIVPFDLMQAAWDEKIAASPLPHITGLIRQVTPAPILVLPRPMPSAALLERPEGQAGFYRAAMARGTAGYARDLFKRLMAPHLGDATALLPQADETLHASGLLTDARFSVGSTVLVDLSRPHGPEDTAHMNAAYGAVCMAQALDALGILPVNGPQQPADSAPQARFTITEPTE